MKKREDTAAHKSTDHAIIQYPRGGTHNIYRVPICRAIQAEYVARAQCQKLLYNPIQEFSVNENVVSLIQCGAQTIRRRVSREE